MLSFRMYRILVLSLGFMIGTLGQVHADGSLAEEVIMSQEEFLSAITPRPTGAELKAHPLYPELVRRVSLIERNWIHQQKGREDAAKVGPAIVVLPNQSDVDRQYLKLLQDELGFKVAAIPSGLDAEAAIYYAYGFNSKQLEVAMKGTGEEKLRTLIQKAAAALGYKSTSITSLLFVPWRFSDSKPIIQGMAEEPPVK